MHICEDVRHEGKVLQIMTHTRYIGLHASYTKPLHEELAYTNDSD